MCSECHQSPCHPRCPNAPDPPIVAWCSECGTEIYAGDDYYRLSDSSYCYECVESARTNAVQEEEYDEC